MLVFIAACVDTVTPSDSFSPRASMAALECPGSRLTGVLVRVAGDLAVRRDDTVVERVAWRHSGHRLVADGALLAVVDQNGRVVARERDTVDLGGGEVRSGVGGICGLFDVEPA